MEVGAEFEAPANKCARFARIAGDSAGTRVSPAEILEALVGRLEVPAGASPAQRVMAASGEVALSATDRSRGRSGCSR